MDKDVVPLLRCPDTGAELELEIREEADNRIVQGTLTSRGNERKFEIRESIAILLPSNPPPGSPDARGWEARALQVEKGLLTRIFSPFEIAAFRDSIELAAEDWLLEVGCGRGRLSTKFTQIPHRHVCVDPSFRNLQICRDRIQAGGYRYTSWVQCDPQKLPFADESFSKIFSAQLLSHFASANEASAMLAELARVCKPVGGIVVSAYSFDTFAKLRKDKNGTHPGGLPYTRFTREEFESLLRRSLLIEDVSQKLQYVWVGHGVPIKEHSVRLT